MRLFTAIGWFFKILLKGNAAFAEVPGVASETAASRPEFHTSPEPAIQLLALFQREGRLLDFLMENVGSYSDADIGAAVRDIHRGCRKVLDERARLRRVMDSAEGTAVEIAAGFDPSAIELVGSVSGEPPYRATLVHGGWYVEELKLPTVAEGADPRVAAPAQAEVRG